MNSKKKYNKTKSAMYSSIGIVICCAVLFFLIAKGTIEIPNLVMIIVIVIFFAGQIFACYCFVSFPKLEIARIKEYMSDESEFEHKISGNISNEDIISKLQQKEYTVYNEGDFILGQKFIMQPGNNIYTAISFIPYENGDKVGYDINVHNQMINDFISKHKVDEIKGNINISCAISSSTPDDIKNICSIPEISKRMNMISAYIPIFFDKTKSVLYYCDGIKKSEDCKVYSNVKYAHNIVSETFEL